jgi:hypothetical protein
MLALVLVPQLVFWPLFTLLVGLAGGGIAWLLMQAAGAPRPARVPAGAAPLER